MPNPEYRLGSEFNDGFRPHYDDFFDEAINRNSSGVILENRHIEALNKYASSDYLQEIPLEKNVTFSLHNK